MKDLVSIIIPCYNGSKTIDRAIDSIYSQNYSPIELIIIDDGSTDDSKKHIYQWISKFEEKENVLKYVFQENRGLGGAINTGLKHVTGDFLMLLDADDEYLPGAILERINFFESHPEYSMVRSNGWRTKGNNRFLFVYDENEKKETNIFELLLKGTTNNWAGSYMLRTDLLFSFYKEREIYASRAGQNLQMLLPMAYRQKAGFIDKPLMNYIQQEDSLSQSSLEPHDAKHKKLTNAEGFRDIRIHLLTDICKNKKECDHYIQIIDRAYWNNVLLLAIEYKDNDLCKKCKDQLCKLGFFSLEEKIIYYNYSFKPFSYFYRLIKKLKK